MNGKAYKIPSLSKCRVSCTGVLYEIQNDWKEIRKKKQIFYRSSEVEFIKFINPSGFSEEFQRLLTEIWWEIQGVIEVF